MQFDLSSSVTSQVTPAISPASQMQSLEKERFVTLGYGSQDVSSCCDNVQLFGSIWLQKFALVVSPLRVQATFSKPAVKPTGLCGLRHALFPPCVDMCSS